MPQPTLKQEPHPTLCAAAFETRFAPSVGSCPSPPWLTELLALNASAPVQRSEELRLAVRDMMRHGGYKPTGRGKPASEYLVKAAGNGKLGSINLAVDSCNVVSLASGLPISVIDLDRATSPLSIAVVGEDVRYVFNAAEQLIRVKGLVCLHDAAGPCANGVKDSQRTKTHEGTVRTLSVVWGLRGYEPQLQAATQWYRELLDKAGAVTQLWEIAVEP